MSSQQIEKKIIHINKSFANVETNLNSKIVYNLKDPLHLRRGDTVSLVKAMVGERGLTADTISFTETQTITLKGHIWTNGNSRKYGNFGTDKHLVQEFGYYPDVDAPGVFKNIEEYGPTNLPCYYVNIIPQLKSGGNVSDPDDYNYWIMPFTVEKTVIIEPGNYTVSALADEVEIQLNGQQTQNSTFRNFVLDTQTQNKGFGGNFYDNEWLIGAMTYKSIYPAPEFPSSQSNYKSLGAFLTFFLDATSAPDVGYCFLDGKTFNYVKEEGLQGRLVDINTAIMGPLVPYGQNAFVYYGLSQGPVSIENFNQGDIHGALTMKENVYGASEFQLVYDTQTINRFAIANLHTPLKIPNYNDFNTSNPNAGQQATKYSARQRNGDPDNRQDGFYPLECSSGFMALSFDYEPIKKLPNYISDNELVDGKTLKQIVASNEATIKAFFNINTHKHYEYYPDNTTPNSAFEGRFWDRLGFTIDQLYNFAEGLEEYYRLSTDDLETVEVFQLNGIITHNDSGFSMATSAGGLGDGILTNDGVPFQPYSTFGVLPADPITGQLRVNTEFYILTTSKFLMAKKYPDLLGGKNYYIVKSNLITNNYYDATSSKSSIIGLINFNFVSNDTIFSTEAIEYPITQDRILNQIIIELTNPDGSPVAEEILTKNSGFLIQIVRDLDIELEVQELVNKPQKGEKKE